MGLQNELNELVEASIISQETADKIANYYEQKKDTSGSRLIIVFGLLGAILVGLGLILIIAHNWDNLSRLSKTIISFIPLIIGQAACLFVLLRKRDSTAWREGASAFLFFAVGSSISLISQVYHIPGDLASFIITWMLLCLPLVYILSSSITSLLYLTGITYYASHFGYFTYPQKDTYTFWVMLALVLPHYFWLYKNKPKSNFMIVHNWIIPLSLIISLGSLTKSYEEIMVVCYINLFGLFYLLGNTQFFKQQKPISNGYRILGALGVIVLLLSLSFDWYWEELLYQKYNLVSLISSSEFVSASLLSIGVIILLYYHVKQKGLAHIEPLAPLPLLFILTFLIGLFTPFSVFLINLYILAAGLLIIRKGAHKDHLGLMNFGLLIITGLITCRFFDSEISFIIRGILFVAVGLGFFIGNYWMIKKRKKHEK